MEIPEKSKPCFILLPGFAPDNFPVLPLKNHLESLGYPVVASNFWGRETRPDFFKLTLDQCLEGVAELIRETKNKYDQVIGIGISLGGSLLIEHAKNNSNLDSIISVGTPFKIRNRKLISLGLISLPVIYPLWGLLTGMGEMRLPPIGATRMVVDYLEGEFLNNFEKVKTPILFLHSKRDRITDYQAVPEFSKKFSLVDKEIIIFENGDHVINYDPKMIILSALKFLNLLKG